MKKRLIEIAVKMIVAALTAFLTAITTTSCMGHGPFCTPMATHRLELCVKLGVSHKTKNNNRLIFRRLFFYVANRIKKSGRIKKAITQVGRKIVVDKKMTMELAKQPVYHRRGA